MKTTFLLLFLCILLLAACTPTSTPVDIPPSDTATATPVDIPPSDTATATPLPHVVEGPIVTSATDSGPGSLRQALDNAQPYDTITFDMSVFPPDSPAIIFISSELPHIHARNLTVDASNAGAILDGSQVPGDWVAGLQIVSAEEVLIMGLQISHFPGPGIGVSGDSKHNVIGGDRGLGVGPWGQGNLLSNNVVGIDLATNGTTLNTVTGNLIGIDLDGSDWLGNERDGVYIGEGAHDNTIGPDNIIANNGGVGVNSEQSDALQNIITQNSIFDNGIGKGTPPYPVIFDFDLAAGTAAGATCPNCTVELFSTTSNEGEISEGLTKADENGVYTFNKGAPFMGPHLIASATHANGLTSSFSWPPTSGTERSLVLQEGNDSQGFLLLPKHSQFLPDNHIGVWFEDHSRYYDTGFVYRNGFKRIRIGSLAGEGQRWITIINAESLSDEVDKTITDYADEGVEIELILASGAGLPFNTTFFQTEEEIERYLEYVSFVVSHFKGRIQYYEIWNEPGFIHVDDYANLIERVVPVIRNIDPDARIIMNANTVTWENDYPGYGNYQRFGPELTYINGLLRSGVAPIVDGISWHPLYGNIPSDPYYQEYPEIVQSIKDLATSQGFTGEYFADEILWATVVEENWPMGPPSSQLIAAKYYTRTIAEHRGLGINVTINTFFQVPFVEPIHNLADSLAGAEPTELPLFLETSVSTNVRYYTFILPDGDKLVALWTNDEAVEDDPGVKATLTMGSFSAQKVIGIDVFHGFEQELITQVENGNLVIRNLLVKDSPTIILFKDAASP